MGVAVRSTFGTFALRAATVSLPLTLSLGPVVAQTPEQSLRDRQAEIDAARPQATPGTAQIPRTSIEAPPGADKVSLILQSIDFVGRDGTTLGEDGRLPLGLARTIFEARLGQTVTLAEIYEIAREVEVFLKTDGFLFTRVLVPRQRIDQEGAKIQLTVLGVTIERVNVEEPAAPIGPVKTLLQDLVAPLNGLENPRIQELERVSLLATDLPGIRRATFVPSQGEDPSLLVLSLNVERTPVNAVGIVSHRDSPVIGPGAIGGTFYANTYGPFGASTQLSYFNSWSVANGIPDLEERRTFQATQKFYLSSGTEFSISGLYSRTEPDVEINGVDADVRGDQLSFKIGARHPFIRTRELSLWGEAGFEWIESEIDLSGGALNLTNDALRVLHLGAAASLQDSFGTTRGEMSVRTGLDILGATSDGATDVSRAGASGEFVAFRAEVQREQPVMQDIVVRVRAVGQWSPDRLLSNETLALGGGRYLKAYDPAELQGDSGFATYAEIAYGNDLPFGTVELDYEVYAFGDFGVVFQSDLANNSAQDLLSTGAGVRISIPSGPHLELELAVPVSDDRQRTQDKAPRLFGSMIWFF